MTELNLQAPALLTRPAAVQKLAQALSREPIIAVDTESNSLHAYREQVCLIQFSTPTTDTLVDPLVVNDLSVLGPVFANPQIEKVFHAAEYDLLCLKRDFHFTFNNLFDTMIAARTLGQDALGLGSMLEAGFGIHADKRFQRADWGQRPLPHHMLSYAQLDTHFLIPLRDRLRQLLQERGLLDLALEDFRRMSQVNGRLPEGKMDDCWRVTGSYDLSSQKAAVLQELCRYRDKVARSLNRPLFKVLSDATLMAIAMRCPSETSELVGLPGMTPGQIGRHGKSLIAAVRRGLQARPVEAPRSPRPNEQFLERLEALRRWRKLTAQDMGVQSDVVLPRDLLHALAERNPSSREELKEILESVPWRLERYGDRILSVLHH